MKNMFSTLYRIECTKTICQVLVNDRPVKSNYFKHLNTPFNKKIFKTFTTELLLLQLKSLTITLLNY